MTEMLILAAIMVAAWALFIWLRVPASISFLSLLIGQLLMTEASTDVYDFLKTILHVPKIEYIQAALLLLPLILTMAFLRNRVPKSKIIIEAIPALFIVSLTILLLGPLIMPLQNLLDAASNDQIKAYKSIVVVAASVSGLLSGWLSYPKPVSKDKHHH